MQTASAALAAAFAIIAGFDAGTNSMLRINRVMGSGVISCGHFTPPFQSVLKK
jgi:hypothetical protein